MVENHLKNTNQANILLIDDKKNNSAHTKKLLKHFETDIFEAASIDKGLSLLHEHDFALILIDIELSDVFKVETVKLIMQKNRIKNIPIIFLSNAYPDFSKIININKTCYIDFLIKPVSSFILKNKIKFFLDFHTQGKKLSETLKQLDYTRTKANNANLELSELNEQLEIAIENANVMAVEAQLSTVAKSRFLANMSHEIRTPMNGIIGFTDMLIETNLNDTQLEFAEIIKRSGSMLLSLINDVLDYSKIEAGELDFESIDFDPELIAYDVCELIKPKIEGKPIELICRIDNNLPSFVKGDPLRYKQVLTNLLGNAPKFTETGEIELSLKMEEENDAEVKLHAEIRDTGVGIPEKKLVSIFTVFQQSDSSITRKFGGTGLGLSIAKQIANLMKGNVWAESPSDKCLPADTDKIDKKELQPGSGSKFHFTAWIAKSDKKRPQAPVMPLEQNKILIVDNNITQLKILAEMLDRINIEVTSCTSGRAALSTFQNSKKPFNICIIDIEMPEIDGYEVARQICKLSNTAKKSDRKPFLLAISSLSKKNTAKCEDFGFSGFLSKPVSKKKFFLTIEKLLCQEDKMITSKQKIPLLSIKKDVDSSEQILLAEDNIVNQKLATLMLTKAGYKVKVACNGKKAVEMYKASHDRFSLIFMDIQMPEMDGMKATEAIREMEKKELKLKLGIPIIAMTANAMKGDREQCLAAGMDDYITKPIKKDRLLAIIEKYIV